MQPESGRVRALWDALWYGSSPVAAQRRRAERSPVGDTFSRAAPALHGGMRGRVAGLNDGKAPAPSRSDAWYDNYYLCTVCDCDWVSEAHAPVPNDCPRCNLSGIAPYLSADGCSDLDAFEAERLELLAAARRNATGRPPTLSPVGGEGEAGGWP